jgi:hypothetical protein
MPRLSRLVFDILLGNKASLMALIDVDVVDLLYPVHRAICGTFSWRTSVEYGYALVRPPLAVLTKAQRTLLDDTLEDLVDDPHGGGHSLDGWNKMMSELMTAVTGHHVVWGVPKFARRRKCPLTAKTERNGETGGGACDDLHGRARLRLLRRCDTVLQFVHGGRSDCTTCVGTWTAAIRSKALGVTTQTFVLGKGCFVDEGVPDFDTVQAIRDIIKK